MSGPCVVISMPGSNRIRGIASPVTLRLVDGHRFTVLPPHASGELRVQVEGGPRAGDYEIGEYLGEQSAGAIIGRTIRWWCERTGIGVSIDPGRDRGIVGPGTVGRKQGSPETQNGRPCAFAVMPAFLKGCPALLSAQSRAAYLLSRYLQARRAVSRPHRRRQAWLRPAITAGGRRR